MTKPKTKASEPKEVSSDMIPFAQLGNQYGLPLDQVRSLIRSETSPTDAMLIRAVETAKMLGVPLQGINIIPSKQGGSVYINSDGIRWLLNTDRRKLKSVEVKIIQMPAKEGDTAVVEGKVVFENGATFTNIGAVVVDKQWSPANALMKAATKAKRRAGQDAVGTPLPIYEDYIEYRDEEMKDITPMNALVNKSNDSAPENLSQFLARLNNAKIDFADACKRLNVAQVTDIKDFASAWKTLNQEG